MFNNQFNKHMLTALMNWSHECHPTQRFDVIVDPSKLTDPFLKDLAFGQLMLRLNFGLNNTRNLTVSDDGIIASVTFSGKPVTIFVRHDQIAGVVSPTGEMILVPYLVSPSIYSGYEPSGIRQLPYTPSEKETEQKSADTPGKVVSLADRRKPT